MRKSFIAFISMTAAAMAVLSCAKVADVMDAPSKGITINVQAGNAMTRTMAVDGEIPSIQWSGGDKVALFEVVDGQVAGAAYSDAGIFDAEGRATFSTVLNWDDIGTEGSSSYQYTTVYPRVYIEDEQCLLYLPDEQYLVGNNFSQDSDILISTVQDYGNTRAVDGENMMFSYRRIGTVVRLRLKGINAGEIIRKVTLQAPVNISGTIVYDPITGNVDPATAYEYYGTNEISLYPEDLEATGDDVIWFRVMCDEDWAVGAEFDISVVTGQGTYHKEVTLPAAIRFPDGGLTRFGVDLSESFVPLEPGYIFQESFEEQAAGWSVWDVDGDGYTWYLMQYPHTGDYCLGSFSWYDNTAYTPDNYLFSPAITLTSGNYLSFWVFGDPQWPDHFGVYILDEESESMEELEELLQADIESGDYYQIVLPIPSKYDGKTVYIIFRHFDCTDMFWFFLDDVAVTDFDPSALSGSSPAPARRMAAPKMVQKDSRTKVDLKQLKALPQKSFDLPQIK